MTVWIKADGVPDSVSDVDLIADRVRPEHEKHEPSRDVSENGLEGQTDGERDGSDERGDGLGRSDAERTEDDQTRYEEHRVPDEADKK
eukprot:2688455-Rhodomonas_salina.1